MNTKINFWLRSIGMMLLAGMLLQACSEDTLLDNGQTINDEMAIVDPTSYTSPFGVDVNSNARMLYGAADCTDEEMYCITSTNYYYKMDDQSWNPSGKTGVYLEYYQNVAGEMKYSFSAYKENNGKDPSLVGYAIDGGDMVSFAKTSNYTLTIPLDEEWAPCDEVARSITIYRNNAQSLTFVTSYTLLAVCDDDDGGGDDDCEVEEFYYELVSGFTYDFTYIPCEALTNANLKFTSPHIKGFSSPAGLMANKGKGKGSPTVLSWTGNIPAEGITVRITFDPDCGQNNAGFALLWTDFKVNEVSKKYLHSDNINIRNSECPKK
jgi:hypothetical protein